MQWRIWFNKKRQNQQATGLGPCITVRIKTDDTTYCVTLKLHAYIHSTCPQSLVHSIIHSLTHPSTYSEILNIRVVCQLSTAGWFYVCARAHHWRLLQLTRHSFANWTNSFFKTRDLSLPRYCAIKTLHKEEIRHRKCHWPSVVLHTAPST